MGGLSNLPYLVPLKVLFFFTLHVSFVFGSAIFISGIIAKNYTNDPTTMENLCGDGILADSCRDQLTTSVNITIAWGFIMILGVTLGNSAFYIQSVLPLYGLNLLSGSSVGFVAYFISQISYLESLVSHCLYIFSVS